MERLRRHIEAITPISDEEFDYIKTFFTLKKVKRHQYLIQEGDKDILEYVIVKGIFRVFYTDAGGKQHTLQFAGEDWWMSDYIAFFNKKPATANAICMKDGEVLSLTLHGREKLSADLHRMEHFFRVKLTNGYVGLQRRIISLLSSTPQQRYEEFAALYPGLAREIPKKYIAEYLGVSRETLSRPYGDDHRDCNKAEM